MLRYFFLIAFVSLCLGYAKEEKFQLSQYVYESIAKVQELMDSEKNGEAKSLLEKLTGASDVRSKLDKAYVRFYLGYFYMSEEHYQDALRYFGEALSYEALPQQQVKSIYFNMMQLYLLQEKNKEALSSLQKLLKLEQKAEYYIYEAQILLSLEEFKGVVASIKKARTLQKPKSEWLQMQFYAHYMLQNYREARGVLQELISMKPYEKEYWMQLASLYALEENSKKTLASFEGAFIAKLDLSEKEILELVSLLRSETLPFHAASILEDSLNSKRVQESQKTLKLLAQLYFEAKNYKKSLQWFHKLAKKEPSVVIDFKIARIYLLEYKYKEAAEALERSLEKPSEKYLRERYELLGKTYFELEDHAKAKEIFRKLLSFPEAKKTAQAWLSYLGG